VPAAVATSATPQNAHASLTRIGLADTFAVIISAADVSTGKPHPEPYLKAAAGLGVPPANCLVIEDSVSGIRAAKAAGAKCLAMATTFSREALAVHSPDWLVAGFADIPADLRP
jgi:beta-phosphoglucomutase-like phosphatase (HAD superfamily)